MSKSQIIVNYGHKVGIGQKKCKRSATQETIMEIMGKQQDETDLSEGCFHSVCLLHYGHLTYDVIDNTSW